MSTNAAFHVSLVFVGNDDLVHTSEVGRFSTYNAAAKAAKRAAGRGSKFSRRGISIGYTGPKGHAAIVE